MKQMLVIVLVAAALMLYGCAQQAATGTQPPAGSNQQPASPAPAPGQGAAPSSSAVKFSDMPVAAAAVQIAPGTLSDAAKAALSGFTMDSVQQADGSLLVTLTETQRGMSNQITLKPGQALYFIETSYGDDPLPNGETSLGDDGYVVVDQNGYVVQ